MMKVNFDTEYLGRLSVVETPSSVDIQDYETCYNYCQLRNSAKDLIRNPKDERAEKTLAGLMLKLNIGIVNLK